MVEPSCRPGGGETMTFSPALSGSSTATSGDYTASNMTLSWANGESGTKNCSITPVNDSTVEPDETVILTLGSATGGVTIGTPSTTTLTILNDDSAGTIQLTGTSFSGSEGDAFIDCPTYFGPDRRNRMGNSRSTDSDHGGGQFRRIEIVRNALTGVDVLRDDFQVVV